MERRLAKLERKEWDRIHALPPHEWLRRGHLSLESLPAGECDELLSILEAAFDEGGQIDHRRLTPEQQERGVELVRRCR